MPLTFDGQKRVSIDGVKFRANDAQGDLIVFFLPRKTLVDHFHAKSKTDFSKIFDKHEAVIHQAARKAFRARSGSSITLTDTDFAKTV